MEQLYAVIRQLAPYVMRPNPKDPKWVEWMKKGLQIATKLQNDKNMPQDVGSTVSKFLYDISAIPEVSGIKTTVRGNLWESRYPPLPPLGYKRS